LRSSSAIGITLSVELIGARIVVASLTGNVTNNLRGDSKSKSGSKVNEVKRAAQAVGKLIEKKMDTNTKLDVY